VTLAFLRTGPALLVQLAGTLGAGADLDGLRASVGRPRGPGVRALFFDLTHVTRLDGLGIGELLRLRRQVQSCGLAFGLLNVDTRHRRLLDVAGLTAVLGVYDGVAAALSSLPSRTPAATRGQGAPRGLMRFSAARGGLGVGGGMGLALL
jgi:anti-anti-sigma regulatory factor